MTASRWIPGTAVCVAVMLLAIVPAACRDATPQAGSPPGAQHPEGTRPVGSADEALVAVSAAVRRAKLAAQPDECLAYSIVEPDADTFEVQVRENHRRAECGGDPQTSPRLFEVRVSRATGEMTTNAGREPDDFQPLVP